MPPCPNCEDYEGDHLGKHWIGEVCSAPEPTHYQKDLFTGMLMGDGCIQFPDHYRNPRMQIEMINREFLDWFDQEMGVFTTGVRLKETAAESFAQMENGDFITPTRVENYHDVYHLYSRNIPWLHTLKSWYSSGSKVFPESLSLTPTIAKMWYVGDGNLNMVNGKAGYAEIRSDNENDRGDYLERLFNEVGFDVNFYSNSIRFSVNETPKFLDWMGDPPPGFSYKWCHDDFDEYRRLKEEAYDQ